MKICDVNSRVWNIEDDTWFLQHCIQNAAFELSEYRCNGIDAQTSAKYLHDALKLCRKIQMDLEREIKVLNKMQLTKEH